MIFFLNVINDNLQLIIWYLKEHKLQWDIRFNDGPFTKQENTRSKKANDIQRAEKEVKCISKLKNDNMGLTEIWINSLINTKKSM